MAGNGVPFDDERSALQADKEFLNAADFCKRVSQGDIVVIGNESNYISRMPYEKK